MRDAGKLQSPRVIRPPDELEGLSLSQKVAIDSICDRYEFEVRSGDRPDIEKLLKGEPAEIRSILFRQLIAVDFELADENNRVLKVEDYLRRFPQFREIIETEAEHSGGSTSFKSNSASEFVDPVGAPIPNSIGRYSIIRTIARGGFGIVYLAFDSHLGRQVAVKVPNRELFSKPKIREMFLREASLAASLRHPGIVTLYDVGDDGQTLFIVQEYIPGQPLTMVMQSPEWSIRNRVEMMAQVSDAVAYAHRRGVVHRDLKPANILIESGRPRLVDFGLAVHQEFQYRLRERCGTPAYMSPEQVRGESHRVDSRSDIWSLGVTLYELLVGRLPFAGKDQRELFEAIVVAEPFSMREFAPHVSHELDRICRKCLGKRKSDRYQSASELASDLRSWLTNIENSERLGNIGSTPLVVPRGLRTFGAEDAEQFLFLLPGPRDRDGLPESIAFWKNRIESTRPAATFPIGLIYGPSGCGKSSLVKAGLIPRLAKEVSTIYVEASVDGTQADLLRGIRRLSPEIPADTTIPEALQGIREGTWLAPNQKLLLVIDQFEQWLHAHRDQSESELSMALRQCDGSRLLCLLLVRDDFWVATNRFLLRLDVQLVEHENQLFVDLFDPQHARNVLTSFGQAYQRLPADKSQFSFDQESFLDRATEGLIEDGKVVCVKLSLLAEMIKSKPWTLATWRSVGGVEGLGVEFLDQTFISPLAPAKYRCVAPVAQKILAALTPDLGPSLIGVRLSVQELHDKVACESNAFARSLHLLNNELRLITPIDVREPGMEGNANEDPLNAQYFKLTHDFLIPSLRDWIDRMEHGTIRGRAELRLRERTAFWTLKSDHRHLPSLLELLSISVLTKAHRWSDCQRKMMRSAARFYGTWLTLAMSIVIACVISAIRFRNYYEQLHTETVNRNLAHYLVQSLDTADTQSVLKIVQDINQLAEFSHPLVRVKFAVAPENSLEKLHLALAMPASDGQRVNYLFEQLLSADVERFPVIAKALSTDFESLEDRLWQFLRGREQDPNHRRLRAACTLARLDPNSAHWSEVAKDVANQLMATTPIQINTWMEALRPVRASLTPPLVETLRSSNTSELQRSLATEILARYAADQPHVLVDLICESTESQFAVLFPILAKIGPQAIRLLEDELQHQLEPAWVDRSIPSNQALIEPNLMTRIRAAHGLLTERFAIVQDFPLNEFADVCNRMKALGFRPVKCRPLKNQATQPLQPSAARYTIAALWIRDELDFFLELHRTRGQILDRDKHLRGEGFIPCDVAGYQADEETMERFAAVWIKDPDTGNADLFVGTTEPELPDFDLLAKNGTYCVSIQHFLAADKHYRYSGVLRQKSAPTSVKQDLDEHGFGSENLAGKVRRDFSAAAMMPIVNSKTYHLRMFDEAQRTLEANPKDVKAMLERGTARCELGQYREAIDDLSAVIKANIDNHIVDAYKYRAMSYAWLGMREQALADALVYSRVAVHSSHSPFLDALIAAILGDENGLENYPVAMEPNQRDWRWLYNASSLQLAGIKVFQHDAAKVEELANKAIDFLEQAIRVGFPHASILRENPDFELISMNPRFQRVLANARLDGTFCSVSEVNSALQSKEAHGLNLDEHLKWCQKLTEEGWRPVSIDVTHPSFPNSPSPMQAGSIWHKPVFSIDKEIGHAVRRAQAAIAILRQGDCENILEALRSSADPEMGTQFIHRCRSRGVTAEDVWRCVAIVDARRHALDGAPRQVEDRLLYTLILALGEFALSDFPVSDREKILAAMSNWYRSDPSSAIHGAAGWLLRTWGAQELVRAVDETPMPYDARRQWFNIVIDIDKQRICQTYIVVAAGAYEIGSPDFEVAHRLDEVKHTVTITQSFAILDREITRREFGVFDPSLNDYFPNYFPTLDQVAGGPTWYESVRFCRWLTRQVDGMTEQDQAYPDPDSLLVQGFEPDRAANLGAGGNPRDWPVHLERPGFRLPVEAEWEVAARAGSCNRFFFGLDNSLLRYYGRHVNSPIQTKNLPKVLRPNAWGLFDTSGSLYEMCHNWYDPYPVRLDRSDLVGGYAAVNRTHRGGCFNGVESACRTAVRAQGPPAVRSPFVGFRPVFVPAARKQAQDR